MAEKSFVKFEINSKVDVEIINAGIGAMINTAGLGFKEAVQKLTEAVLVGDQEAAAAAKVGIGEYATGLDALAVTVVEVKEFLGSNPALTAK